MCDHRDNENRIAATTVVTPYGVYLFVISMVFYSFIPLFLLSFFLIPISMICAYE